MINTNPGRTTASAGPRVTIGMPVYNGEAFIHGALDSLLRQSFSDFELHISDNASTDRTEDICQAHAAVDSRIHYRRQPTNLGASANFREVFLGCKSRYFMWAAADDRRDSRFLELAVQVLDQREDVGLVFSAGETLDLTTNHTVEWDCGYSTSPKKWLRYLYRLINGCPSLVYGLHRTSVLDKIPFDEFDYFDIYLSHWYELNSRIVTLPLKLFTAGTVGTRVPYSLTGSRIDDRRYLEMERRLLRIHFSLPISLLLYSITRHLIRSNTKQLLSA
jgi:glycosyltransferase involved in cell wall biosynthesis